MKGVFMIKVKLYNLETKDGRHIRKATKVIIGDDEVTFIEWLPKKQAIKQALEFLRKER